MSITERELEEYFQRRQAERNVMGGAKSEAARIVRDILAHRESEYEPGEIYADPGGNYWKRTDGGDWLTFGSKHVYAHNYLMLPLRKMVPLPSHDELVAVLIESIAHDVSGYEGQAQRVLKLLNGEKS
jgi:hypothetical protein